MKKQLLFGGAAVLLLSASLSAAVAGPPVSVVVTAETKRGKAIPTLAAEDVAVAQGRDQRPVTTLEPLGDAKLQLLLLIDDSAASSFNTELPTLRNFVTALPGNAEVAVGYMRNGMAQMTSDFTHDHEAAAKGIRVAMGPGGADTSPYDSLADAIKKWPAGQVPKREIVMISSGVEGLGGGLTPDNPYVRAGISAAQRAGVVVYTIYTPSAGHAGHSLWRGTWGQNFLSQLSDETGGESYAVGFGAPVSFEPYLNAILEALPHQYLVTFTARAEGKAGLQEVHIRVKEKDASLAAPDKVFVRAGL